MLPVSEEEAVVEAPQLPVPTEDPKRAGCIGSLLALMGFFTGSLYILNPTGGFIELLPDNLPLVGNLDEAGATTVVVLSLQYLGRHFRRRSV